MGLGRSWVEDEDGQPNPQSTQEIEVEDSCMEWEESMERNDEEEEEEGGKREDENRDGKEEAEDNYPFQDHFVLNPLLLLLSGSVQ